MSSLILVLMMFFEMIMLPIQLKFGGDKGRIVLVGIVAAGALLFSVGKKILSGLGEKNPEINRKIYELPDKVSEIRPGMAVGMAVLILGMAFVISYQYSLKIIKKREF